MDIKNPLPRVNEAGVGGLVPADAFAEVPESFDLALYLRVVWVLAKRAPVGAHVGGVNQMD